MNYAVRGETLFFRLGGIALLAVLGAAPMARAQEAEIRRRFAAGDLDSEHFSIAWHGGSTDPAAVKAMAEALFPLWKAKLGCAVEPSEKLRVEIYPRREEYEKHGAKGTSHEVREGVLRLLDDKRTYNALAAGGTILYLRAAYPKAMGRTDLPGFALAGLADYFGASEWKDGAIRIDATDIPDVSSNALSLKQLVKFNDWVALDKSFKLKGREFEHAKGIVALQAWALFYYLFNAPGDSGGKGEAAAAVPEFLKALEAGEKFADAFAKLLKKTKPGGLSGLDKPIRSYLDQIARDVPDREEGEWLVGETAHYTIFVQKGAENRKLRWKDKDVLRDMKFKMELLFTKYAQAFQFNGKLSQRPRVRLYKNKEAYHRAGGPPDSAAYYSPATKELVGYEDSAETGIVFQIFCHEGCHQFFDLAFPGFYESEDLPMWFSEGLADCFGASEIRGQDLFVFTLSGVATWRLETIKTAVMAKQHPSIPELLEMGRQPFRADSGLHYAQSWSFCHFLYYYPGLDQGTGQYRDVMIRLIDGFKQGLPKSEVYDAAFRDKKGKPLDLNVLEAQWKDYVRKLRTKR